MQLLLFRVTKRLSPQFNWLVVNAVSYAYTWSTLRQTWVRPDGRLLVVSQLSVWCSWSWTICRFALSRFSSSLVCSPDARGFQFFGLVPIFHFVTRLSRDGPIVPVAIVRLILLSSVINSSWKTWIKSNITNLLFVDFTVGYQSEQITPWYMNEQSAQINKFH